ncbi:MAG: 3-deoxy-7-phosphoheptulonate synthase [Patescibacteria group bacterium]|jgi:3-deoxy-7-phosphoheptulonate synthase
MFVQIKGDCSKEQIGKIQSEARQAGFEQTLVSCGKEIIVINCIGAVDYERKLALQEFFRGLPFVIDVVIATTQFRLTARQAHPEDFAVRLNGVSIGSAEPLVVIAGPCAVESEQQLISCAEAVKAAGARLLRGGAYKPRKSIFAFQGLGEEGLRLLQQAKRQVGLATVTEVISPELVELVAQYADVLQIGTANMGNYPLLEAVGRTNKPVILKRGMAATINEWLLAAEYIVASGNPRVILCARGVRGIDNGYTRFNADLDAIPVVKKLTHHPVIFDPSHPSGKRELVPDIALGAVAVGADGLLIEVHPDPDSALCDGAQSLYPQQFAELMIKVRAVAIAIGRTI